MTARVAARLLAAATGIVWMAYLVLLVVAMASFGSRPLPPAWSAALGACFAGGVALGAGLLFTVAWGRRGGAR